MSSEVQKLKLEAESARTLYKQGVISREEAMNCIMPYINMFNQKSREIAKKWNQKPKTISFAKYCR